MKFVFILLCALGAALYFPESRAVVLEASEPVLNPVFRWSTRGEMRKIARDLESLGQAGRDFPAEQEAFVEWMDRNYQGVTSTIDAWGATYHLQLRSDSFTVVSPGPDGELGTGDEVEVGGSRAPRRR